MTALAWQSEDPAVHAVHDVERGVYLMVDVVPLEHETRCTFAVRRSALDGSLVSGTVYADDVDLAKRVAEAVAGVVAQSGGGL